MRKSKRILKRPALRFLPIFFLFATRSRALADLAWDPSPGFDREDISPRMLLLIILICIIGLVWLLAKARMLKHYDRGSGWRIIVPFHGRYLEYKNYWDEKYYWINFFVCFFTFCAVVMLFSWKYTNIIFYTGISCWVVITIIMRIKTLEAFGQKKFLVLLELLGLGFVLDCLCALACIRNESEEMTDAASEIDK